MNLSTLGAPALFSLTTMALAAWSGSARAQDQVAPVASAATVAPMAPVPVTTETTSQATGPSMMMVGSGVAIFGLSYAPAFIVGLTSGLDADHTLLVPLAGPWIDFAQRPGCGGGSRCNTENTNKVLLATDGVFQALGALTVIGGFLTPAHQEVQVQRATADAGPTFHFSPAQVGASGYGMLASGAF